MSSRPQADRTRAAHWLLQSATLVCASLLLTGSEAGASAVQETQASPLPRVLIIGDSISLGYTPFVEKALAGKAEVVHAKGNNAGTTLGLAKLDEWLGKEPWDLIHFNWGLHDLKHVRRDDRSKNSNDPADPQQADLATYTRNLEILVKKLEKTEAKLIFATTTPYPAGVKPLRKPEDAVRYNDAARVIMKKYEIPVNDLYSAVLPELEELQQPVNVHFKPEGSKFLARHVEREIRRALGIPPREDEEDRG